MPPALAHNPVAGTGPGSAALRALRERTRELHLELESRLRLGAADAGREQYASHVAAMWGWLQPIEQRLWERSQWPGDLDTAPRACKTGWLHDDIRAACDDGFITASATEVCAQAPDFADTPTRFGWAYVIEGSMLGGHVLHRRLAARLSPWPVRYLQGYGAQAGSLWREFLAALERNVRSDAHVEQASEAAAQAFASIGDWMRSRGAA